VCATDIAEEAVGDPGHVVVANALRKARAAQERLGAERPILGADTEVYLAGRLFGKPRDEAEARRFLEALAGRTHDVYTGLALLGAGTSQTGVARSAVTFHPLDDAAIDDYVATGEWRGRAGGYAVQGHGERLVAGIDGDYWNVVGLPTSLLLNMAPWLTASA
jgi:septum formation protein